MAKVHKKVVSHTIIVHACVQECWLHLTVIMNCADVCFHRGSERRHTSV